MPRLSPKVMSPKCYPKNTHGGRRK